MLKKIEPSEIGKKPDLISKAQKEMASSDVLVCGKCHTVFQIIDSFQEHKASNCKKFSAFSDTRETRPKIWAYLLWKQTYYQTNPEIDAEDENPWKLYQQWMKLDESTRQSWLVAGGTIQSFDKFGNGVLQETPVKITKTLTPEKPLMRPSPPVSQVVKRVVAAPRPNVIVTENRIIKRADDSRGSRMINRTDPISGIIDKASIEKIMAKRVNPRKKENEYLVKWELKPQTWEPASHLDTCKDLIDNFEVLLAKQKEMRAKTQLQQQQNNVASQPQATSTPTAAVPNRPVRFSKEKAISQVKQWTGGNKQEEPAEVTGKRKLEEDDDFDEDDCDDIDDEDYELESSWEKKKMAQQLGQTSVKRIKTEINQNGNVRVLNKSNDMQIGATVVRRVIGGAKSPDAIIAGQKQQSGVFKKASPGQVLQKKPGEGQVRIVGANQQIKSGIVRVQAGTTPISAANKPNLVTRVVAKTTGQPIRNSPSGTGTVVRTVQSVQNQQKTLAQKIIQRSPIAGSKANQSPVARPGGQVVTRQPLKSPGQTIVRKAGTAQQQVVRRNTPVQTRVAKKAAQEEEDDGIPDPFPKDLPPIEAESASPPPPMTLCPITGKVLGEGEVAAAVEGQEATDGEVSDQQHQITQLLSNEDGTPIYITGDDGTMYQVAGKNSNGETILVSTNAEGEQTCILLPADQDLLAGLPGIQTTDATEAAIEGAQMSVEAAVAEAVGATAEDAAAVAVASAEGGEEFPKEGEEAAQEGEEATQPLSIAVGGEGGESQDGQITAEIVQADEPSPGGTRKVVLMLPDGNLMVTELSSDQFQSLNIQQ